MKPFRKHVAIAIDGGGIRGVIVAKALVMLEQCLQRPVHDIFRLAAGTSTGAILSVGTAAGLTAGEMLDLYIQLGKRIFRKSLSTLLWPLVRYRYPLEPLQAALQDVLGSRTMGSFWKTDLPTDLVITSFDLVTNHTCFIKPWKPEYQGWSAVQAVLASSAVPTYFPVVSGRYVDGGVGSYANPCYLAAYEIRYCLNWDPAETTLISLGTGRGPFHFDAGQGDRFYPWQWIGNVLGAFLQSADDQQVHLVNTFFDTLDFRRFQVDLPQPIEMDDASKIDLLVAYGEELGNRIISDSIDPAQNVVAPMINGRL